MKIHKRLKLLKSSAKKRGISVKLNIHHYEKLLELGCTYCGKNLENDGGYCLDRLDNSIGYHDHNCLPSCWDCNRAKGSMNFDDFMTFIKRVYDHDQNQRMKFDKLQNFNFKKKVNILTNSSAYRNSDTIKIEGTR